MYRDADFIWYDALKNEFYISIDPLDCVTDSYIHEYNGEIVQYRIKICQL